MQMNTFFYVFLEQGTKINGTEAYLNEATNESEHWRFYNGTQPYYNWPSISIVLCLYLVGTFLTEKS